MKALLAALLTCAAATFAQAAPGGPRIAIVIDDLGHNPAAAARVAALPGPVACAVLPYAPYAEAAARACHAAGKPVLLHLPMQSTDPDADPGPGALALGQARADLERLLDQALARVPHASAVNNHMGSALTPRVAYMHWLMAAMAERGLWFLDSYTTPASLAAASAGMAGVPALRRDVFLDHAPGASAVAGSLERLLLVAAQQGAAVAIGHPLPDTLAVLEAVLPGLPERGYELVPPADMMVDTPAGESAWRAYSSPLPPASRKSRP